MGFERRTYGGYGAPSKNIFSGVVEQFWNPQKGGLQIGGIIGGIAAGALAFSQLGMGSWYARLALVVATTLGAYVTNRLVDAYKTPSDSTPHAPPAKSGKSPQPSQTPGKDLWVGAPYNQIDQGTLNAAVSARPETTVQQTPENAANTAAFTPTTSEKNNNNAQTGRS